MDKLNLKHLFRNATRGLPQHADARVTVDETLALARGESLGERGDAAISGIGSSSDQALALKIAIATEAWSRDLASDLAQARRPTLAGRIARWLQAATLPPVFAACAISLLAVAAWRISEPALAPLQSPPTIAADDSLFGGDFDESVASHAEPDQVFGGDFDS